MKHSWQPHSWSRSVSIALAAAFLTSVTGCAWIVAGLQNPIAGNAVPVELVTITTKWPNVLQCVRTTGGMCKASKELMFTVSELRSAWTVSALSANPNTSIARRALSNPTVDSLEHLMSYAAGQSSPPAAAATLSRESARSFAKDLFDATNTGEWWQLTADMDAERNRRLANPALQSDDPQTLALSRAIRAGALIGAYLSAYFEDGHFVTLTVDPSNLTTSAETELQSKLGLSSEAAKATVGDVIKQLTGETVGADGKYHLLTAKGDGGFVTRGGDKYAFPTISVAVTPGAKQSFTVSKVDFGQIGADIIRVYLEAVGDLRDRLPGTQQSTGVTQKVLRAFGQDPSVHEQLDETQFMKVHDWSSRAETATAGATGQLIRGIGWISLNNESLARIIETAVGVAVRKGAEKVVWCVEACGSVSEQVEFTHGGAQITTIKVVIVK